MCCNSLAAIAVATELGVAGRGHPARAWPNFQGIDRRLQQLGEIAWPAAARLHRR